ncbi:hypothetical protein TSUD_52280 [Trifolium subterraneum]|uniref:Uncharacterized protein n=1 Tax=Trifolium subterraneum TaxID=3900 RepID=A0A2Z6N8F8_TRISU|nr:hypothetical protein TSUD_52280 [Trifolium subterraneum]
MATTMMSRALILFLTIVPLFVSSEARDFPKFSSMMSTKKVSSELLLQDIVKNIARDNSEYIHKRSMLGKQLERMAPAGPDAQHH